jgi:peroxiredoxin
MSKGSQKPLEIGDLAPEVSFFDATGREHSLQSLLAAGPVLLAFFKVSCPVCQLTLPYLQRISGTKVRIVPVSQDSAAATLGFSQAFGVQLPFLFDRDEDDYPASNAFNLAYVPSMFLVERDRRISWEWTGFHKRQLEALAERAGRPMFHSGDMVPEMKAG